MSKHPISEFEAQDELQSFLQSDPELANVSSQVLRGLEAIGPLASGADADLAFARLQSRIEQHDTHSAKSHGVGHKFVRYAVTAGLVAIVAGLISIDRFALSIGTQPESAKFATYTTAPGKRAQLELPDGSLVSLSVASRIRYAKNFGKAGRDIYLEGEAYFEVPRNTNAPLVVHTGNVATRVIGTSFGVRQYQGEPTARVIVNAGKVHVKSTSVERVVSSGEAVQAGMNTIAMIPLNPAATAWMRGELIFTKTPLSVVVKELERWYGINIKLDDPALGKELVTVTLGSQPPQDAIRIIAMMFGAQTAHSSNTITIDKR